MSSVSQFLYSTSPKAIAAAGPGSNGYWCREMFLRAGAYTFTAKKTGKHKIYVLGAAGGGGYTWCGCSGALACIEVNLATGDNVAVTVGSGGAGNVNSLPGGDGGTTSVVCAATGRAFNVTVNGAKGGNGGGAGMVAATATITGVATTLFNRNGGVPAVAYRGGCASASPWGNGIGPITGSGSGGCGWGGAPDSGSGGSSSHFTANSISGARGVVSRGGQALYFNTGSNVLTVVASPDGESLPWWDLTDFDGGGGAGSDATSGSYPNVAGNGGIGAGGGARSTGNCGHGGFGGGGGAAGNGRGGNGGNGAGGGSSSGDVGGRGGDGAVLIYWDEVA